MAVEALNPGTPVKRVSNRPSEASRTVDEWKERLGDADMWHVPFTDPGWMGGDLTFFFADATYVHIKL